MSIIGEAVQAENMEDLHEEFEAAADFAQQEIPKTRISDLMPDFSFIFCPTGPGSVDTYIDHPFNINESKGTARIIRGLTGIAGDLNYAIVDIALGAVEVYQEGHKKKEVIKNEPITYPE